MPIRIVGHIACLILPIMAICITSSIALHAGEFNQVLSIGDRAPEWKDLPGTDGELHSFADFKKKKFLVVVFTCNSCPYAEDYEDRIVSFADRHATKESDVGIVAINVNKIDEDSLPKMKERAEEKGFTFPYLFDETQKIAREYGAGFTPEFYVLDQDRKIVYMGAMDDDTNADAATVNYVEKALESARKGEKPETAETIPIGCRIRFVRERKKS